MDDVLDNEASEHVAENGGDMYERSFALALGLDELVGIDTKELARGGLPLALDLWSSLFMLGRADASIALLSLTQSLETLAKCTCQGVALNLPKLCNFDAGRVKL